jgi:SNF2 family DNA or RNA helicase
MFVGDATMEAEARRLGGSPYPDLGENVWSFPPLYCTIAQLKRSFGDIDIDSSVEAEGFLYPHGFGTLRLDLEHSQLYDFQKEAVTYLNYNPHHGAILALSPGLGKTYTAIVAAQVEEAFRVLVVAPLVLVPNWIAEIKHWASFDAIDCHGKAPPEGEGWSVVNYETVVAHKESYRKLKFDILIIDESIMVKNRNSLRSKAMQMLSRNADKVWLLSGSPVSKYADDLYMQLSIVEPKAFRSYWRFANQYCFIEKTIWGDKIVGTRPNIDFKDEFKDLMFVRNQKDVLPELPEVLHEAYSLEMGADQKKMYDTMNKEFLLELEGGTLTASTKLAQLTRLQQIVSCPESLIPETSSCKLDMVKTLINTQTLPMPAIIWVNFKATAEALYTELRSAYPDLNIQKVTGDTEVRSKVFEGFQWGAIDILILSIGVGKYGLTLTKAASATYYDRTFDGDAYVQSLARIHRIGLDHSPVVITLRVPRTTDSLIDLNLQGKMKSIASITNHDLLTLMKGLE